MIGLCVNSVGNHNYPLCWSIIPHQSEGELTYTGTFLQLQEAVVLAEDLHTCSNASCHFCNTYDMLLRNANVDKFFKSDRFTKLRQIPVDTAQCDQLTGWGNFTREVLGIDSNTCCCHLTGIYEFHLSIPCH
jgi:hypothetical protein